VNHRHGYEKLHDFGLHKELLIVVPLGTFKEETSDVSAVSRRLSDINFWARSRDKVERQFVNRRTLVILTRELLQQTRGETSRVGISRDPVYGRRVIHLVGPELKEIVSFFEIDEPIAKTLKREVSEGPLDRYLILAQTSHHDLQVG